MRLTTGYKCVQLHNSPVDWTMQVEMQRATVITYHANPVTRYVAVDPLL